MGNRRLYLGNLPYHLGVTEDSFSKQLYETMRDRGMCNDPNQNPVLHVWFARDKGANYGFCEVSSMEETERALQLDGMLVLGVPVSIKPGDVYIQCHTTDDATKIMRAMGHRKYDGRQINMTSFEEGKFNAELKHMM